MSRTIIVAFRESLDLLDSYSDPGAQVAEDGTIISTDTLMIIQYLLGRLWFAHQIPVKTYMMAYPAKYGTHFIQIVGQIIAQIVHQAVQILGILRRYL